MSDHHNRYGRDKHHERSYDSSSHHGHGHYLMYIEYAKKILRNKTFLMMAVVLLIILLIAGIWVISLLIPFLGQLLSSIEKNGIKGIIETISPYLLKLWEGTGK